MIRNVQKKLWNAYNIIHELLEDRQYSFDYIKDSNSNFEPISDTVDPEENTEDVKEYIEPKITCRIVDEEIFYKVITPIKCEDDQIIREPYTQNTIDNLTICARRNETGEWILVYFVLEKLNYDLIKKYVYNKIELYKNIHRIIFVTHAPRDVKSIIPKYQKSPVEKYTLEHFYIEWLQFNRSRHELVPKHIQILYKFDNDTSKFPILNSEDIQAKWLGLQENDIVKIIRPSSTNGFATTYRICKKIK